MIKKLPEERYVGVERCGEPFVSSDRRNFQLVDSRDVLTDVLRVFVEGSRKYRGRILSRLINDQLANQSRR